MNQFNQYPIVNLYDERPSKKDDAALADSIRSGSPFVSARTKLRIDSVDLAEKMIESFEQDESIGDIVLRAPGIEVSTEDHKLTASDWPKKSTVHPAGASTMERDSGYLYQSLVVDPSLETWSVLERPSAIHHASDVELTATQAEPVTDKVTIETENPGSAVRIEETIQSHESPVGKPPHDDRAGDSGADTDKRNVPVAESLHDSVDRDRVAHSPLQIVEALDTAIDEAAAEVRTDTEAEIAALTKSGETGPVASGNAHDDCVSLEGEAIEPIAADAVPDNRELPEASELGVPRAPTASFDMIEESDVVSDSVAGTEPAADFADETLFEVVSDEGLELESDGVLSGYELQVDEKSWAAEPNFRVDGSMVPPVPRPNILDQVELNIPVDVVPTPVANELVEVDSPANQKPASETPATAADSLPRIDFETGKSAWEVDSFHWPLTTTQLVRREHVSFVDLFHSIERTCDRRFRSLAVTGIEPGEGCSTVAICMARSMVSAGKSVLLIDGNLENSQLGNLAGLDVDLGWHNSIPREVPISESLVKCSSTGLTLLVLNGRSAMEMPTRLTSLTLTQIVKESTKWYDVVILDAGVVADLENRHREIPMSLDATLLVCNANGMSPNQMKDAQAQLGSIGLENVAVAENFGHKLAG